jgi:hypothetical protein
MAEALNVTIDVLKDLGEPMPTAPGILTISYQYLKTARMLRGKTDEFFLSMPAATDSTKVAAMTLLSFAWANGYTVKPEYAIWAVFRLLQLALRHGMTGPAASGFCGYGLLLCTVFGKAERGRRFGQLALTMLAKFEAKSWVPRTHFFVYGLIFPWSRPLHSVIEPLANAHQAALLTGDNEASVLCATAHAMNAFHAGQSLIELEGVARSYIEKMNELRLALGLILVVPFWHCLTELLGLPMEPLSLSGNIVDPRSACTYAQKEDNKIALAEFYVDRAIVSTFLGEYEPVLVAAKKSQEFVPYADYRRSFYEDLSALASARSSTGHSRRKLIVLAKKRLKDVRYWSSKGSPNFHNMVALLQAELAAVRGKGQLALSLFDKSIKAAKKERFIHTEGLAYERLASYHRFLGNEPSAIAYFERARDCYKEWGAYVVVRRIEQYLLGE